MKTKFNIISILLLMAVILVSCEKEESTDFRDQYIGMYSGTVTYSIPEEGYWETKPISARITKGYGDTELNIQGLGLPYAAIAVLNNSTYKYYPFSTGGTSSCSVTTHAIYNGTGTFNGDSLTETGTLTLGSNGYMFTGTWSTKLVKQ